MRANVACCHSMPVLLDSTAEHGGTEFVHWLCMSVASRSLTSCTLNYIQAGKGNTLPAMLDQMG